MAGERKQRCTPRNPAPPEVRCPVCEYRKAGRWGMCDACRCPQAFTPEQRARRWQKQRDRLAVRRFEDAKKVSVETAVFAPVARLKFPGWLTVPRVAEVFYESTAEAELRTKVLGVTVHAPLKLVAGSEQDDGDGDVHVYEMGVVVVELPCTGRFSVPQQMVTGFKKLKREAGDGE